MPLRVTYLSTDGVEIRSILPAVTSQVCLYELLTLGNIFFTRIAPY